MKQIVGSSLIAALLVTMMPVAADAFRGMRGARVNPVDQNVFEVVPRGSQTSGRDFWCGAGEYAYRELRAAWSDRIFIVQGRSQSVTTERRSAVQFTMNPEAAGIVPIQPALSLNAMKVGDNMSVTSAFNYCNQPPVRF
jgi:hypothetical protein